MLSLKGVYNHGQIKLDQTIESDREISPEYDIQ